MDKTTMNFLRENYGKNAKKLAENLKETNKTLERILGEMIAQAQEKQVAKDFKAATELVEQEKLINTLIQKNNKMIEALVEQEEEKIGNTRPRPRKVRATLNDDLRFTKPHLVEINGEKIEVATWKDVLYKTTEFLYNLNPKKFEELTNEKTLTWGEKHNLTRDKDTLRTPKEVANTGIYVEMRKDATATKQMIAKMLKKFEIDVKNYKLTIKREQANAAA